MTPELIFTTMAPMTGHNTVWSLQDNGHTIDIRLDHGTRVQSIDNLNTGRSLKPTSKRGQAITAQAVAAYHLHFGEDPTQDHAGYIIPRPDRAGGFICKRCSEPSPLGIGYAAAGEDAAQASATTTACKCGYSRKED